MALTEDRRDDHRGGHDIIELDADDVDDGLALSSEAGWNQSAADWAMMLRVGKGFGIRSGGRVVASSLALPYPPRFGWVSMVLVTESHRRRGLATALLRYAVAYLESLGLTPMLDATPAGRQVYLPLGFQDVEPISRWRHAGMTAVGDRACGPIDMARVGRVDRAAFGADRTAVLADLVGRSEAVALSLENGAFLLSRAGRTATQVGPIVADTSAEAVDLLERGLERLGGPLLIDVPDRETALVDVLERNGFAVERAFSRMALGRGEGYGDPGKVRAVAGPELG